MPTIKLTYKEIIFLINGLYCSCFRYPEGGKRHKECYDIRKKLFDIYKKGKHKIKIEGEIDANNNI